MPANHEAKLKEIAAWHFECFERSLSYTKALETYPAFALRHLNEALHIVASVCPDNTELLQELGNLGNNLLRLSDRNRIS